MTLGGMNNYYVVQEEKKVLIKCLPIHILCDCNVDTVGDVKHGSLEGNTQ